MPHSRRQQNADTGGGSRKTFGPANYFAVLDTFIPSLSFVTTEQNIHGGIKTLSTGDALNSGSPIAATAGIGKIMLVLNAGSDVAGTITVTGTSVDRDTGVETASDTDDLTVDALTTDAGDTDGNGNTRHSLTGAYITSKWFKGAVTISTADTTFTDVDTYQCSFEQINDTRQFIVDTFDVNFLASHVSAEFDTYLYSIVVTDDKVDVTRISSLNSGATTNGEYHRLRSGNIGATLAGATDGLFVDGFASGTNHLESLTLKVWVAIVGSGTDVLSLRLQGAKTPASVTDNAIVRWDGTDGENLQNSNSTISDAGVVTHDDGSGNTVTITPDSTAPSIATSAPNLVVTANNASTTAIMQMRNATTSKATKFQVGSDAAGGTGAIDADSVTARRANGNLTLAGNGTGGVVADGRNIGDDGGLLDNVKTRQAIFSFVDPTASQDFLFDGMAEAATITQCYAIVKAATSVVFSVVMRARSAPFSGGTNIVNAQTATTTGGTKTLASTTYTPDNVLRLTTGTVTGTPGELLVILVYTVNA